MGLFDSQIEAWILWQCIDRYGAKYAMEYKVNRILPRIVKHPFTVKIDGKEIFSGAYVKKYFRKDNYSFTTK